MSERDEEQAGLVCPVPNDRYSRILLAHGGGGRLMHSLVQRLLIPAFDNPALRVGHDGAVLDVPQGRVAFTTDSYVVNPLFFPGGDIGRLAVYGTVNDLAMCGARPRFLSVGLILEEGLEMATLERVVLAMAEAARECAVELVTGDTKVVDQGNCDGLFINTSGIGVVDHERKVSPGSVEPGDVILLSGDVGRHGIAVMAAREGIEFDTTLVSDLAPLTSAVFALMDAGIEVHCLRDLTRGGLGGALVELAETANVGMTLRESHVPVSEAVRGACEILGLDPLFVANEGRFIAIVSKGDASRALAIMGAHAGSEAVAHIGEVLGRGTGQVIVRGALGVERPLDMPSGEQLPRIC